MAAGIIEKSMTSGEVPIVPASSELEVSNRQHLRAPVSLRKRMEKHQRSVWINT